MPSDCGRSTQETEPETENEEEDDHMGVLSSFDQSMNRYQNMEE